MPDSPSNNPTLGSETMTKHVELMLHPEVLELYKQRKLHLYDAEWISRLPRRCQVSAANKVMRNFNTRMLGDYQIHVKLDMGGSRSSYDK